MSNRKGGHGVVVFGFGYGCLGPGLCAATVHPLQYLLQVVGVTGLGSALTFCGFPVVAYLTMG